MKAICLERYEGIEAVSLLDRPDPSPTSTQVKIKVAYAGVNPVDWKISEGRFKDFVEAVFPTTLGCDASGEIIEVGSDVSKFKLGDKVFGLGRFEALKDGAFAEYVCMEEHHVAHAPKSITSIEAAGIPLATLTAWQSLYDAAKLQAGQSILIHAGAGGVGSMAIQLAKLAGAKIYTTASSSNHEYVKSLGADIAIDYHSEDFVNVMKSHEPEGVDLVLGSVAGETLQKSYELVKRGGNFISITESLDEDKMRHLGIHGMFSIVHADGLQLEEIAKLIDAGKIKAPAIREMSFGQASAALRESRSGKTRGKIVLKVAEGQ